ncbi:MAG: hypothetical protein ACLUOD_15515 [[Clostridium] innocuum]
MQAIVKDAEVHACYQKWWNGRTDTATVETTFTGYRLQRIYCNLLRTMGGKAGHKNSSIKEKI